MVYYILEPLEHSIFKPHVTTMCQKKGCCNRLLNCGCVTNFALDMQQQKKRAHAGGEIKKCALRMGSPDLIIFKNINFIER